ncbi:MAG: hypothetical protein ABL952_01940 [Pyrinomonadaceae bacterium]
MTIIEIVIIYLALGTPLGVYKFASLPDKFTGLSLLRTTFAYFAWPAAAPRLAYRIAVATYDEHTFTQKVEHIRGRIESLAFAKATSAEIFEFREIFYRYTGLTEAGSSIVGTDHITNLDEIGFIADPATAARCSARRNISKISTYQSIAREDLIALVRSINHRDPEIAGQTLDLAVMLNDKATAEQLHEMLTNPVTHETSRITSLAA